MFGWIVSLGIVFVSTSAAAKKSVEELSAGVTVHEVLSFSESAPD